MALLATLEGENGTITLDDLFDVNDFLGVRYFGPENWNRIKKCACIITSNASNSPVVFWLDNLKNDYPQPSELSKCLFGFNDRLGALCMGAPAWNAVKSKIDAELLGFPSITGAVKAIGSGIKKGLDVAKSVATTPITAYKKFWTATPLKYTPGGYFVEKTSELHEKATAPIKDAAQYVTDTSSEVLYKAATKTPLKYTGYGLITKLTEQGREAAGITSPGTAEVYESEEEIIRQKRAAAEAAAKAASAASVAESKRVTAEKKVKAQAEQTAQAQAEAIAAAQAQAATQTALEQTQATLTSKYAPWLLGGAGVLLALSILKK